MCGTVFRFMGVRLGISGQRLCIWRASFRRGAQHLAMLLLAMLLPFVSALAASDLDTARMESTAKAGAPRASMRLGLGRAWRFLF